MKGLLRFCWQCVSRVVCSWIGFSYHVSNVSSVLDMNNAIFCPPRVEAQNFACLHLCFGGLQAYFDEFV